MDLSFCSIKQIRKGIKNKEFSVEELVTSALDKIKTTDVKIKAYLTICKKQALAKAKLLDKKIAQGEKLGMLAGVTYSAKDVFSTKGIRTTASSKILENYIPPYDATAIKRLNRADAILLGKTNNDAFGFGSSTENSDFQITRNPWNLAKVPGGSSGGSAAAVAVGMGTFSLAEDTGGSIRQPASFCGVTGLKVTYGRVSRYGVLAYGSSLDTIGVITRDVEDAAILFEIIAGKDPFDATTLPDPVPNCRKSLNQGIKGIRIGVPREYFAEGIEPSVEKSVKRAISKFEELGAFIDEVSLPSTKFAVASYYLSGISEVSANLARYDGIRFGYSNRQGATIEEMYLNTRREGFNQEVKRRIMLGTYALSAGYYDAYYKKAQQVRTLIKKDFEKVFTKVDILITPVSPFPPFNIGEKTDDPLKMWLADIFTVTINPAGIPALALPCGFTRDGLPIGMQIVGPQLSEELLFRAGYAYQQITDWHKRRPSL